LHRQQVRLIIVMSRRNFVVNVTATPLFQVHWVFFFLREASRCSFTADFAVLRNWSTVCHRCFYSRPRLFVCTAAQSIKRPRTDASNSPVQQDLNRLVAEQVSIIESLKKEKSTVESSLALLKTDHEKISKENTLFRRAVTIQQDRQNQAENQIKAAQQYRAGADDQIKKMEQVILSLRYHLQAQPSLGNDFMGNRFPDVY
jgi:hypothetical protein